MSARTLIIGDVHGCLEELQELLAKLEVQPEDEVIFLGDLINYGPDSLGVLRLVEGMPNARCIIGNHELRFLRYWRSGKKKHLKPVDLELFYQLEEQDWELFRKMQPCIYLEKYDTLCVHGGFLPDKLWQEQSLSTIARIQVVDEDGKARKRSSCPDGTIWADLWKGPPFVVYGHTPRFADIYEQPSSVCIDTACAQGGKLSAYVLPDKEVVQVDAKNSYRY